MVITAWLARSCWPASLLFFLILLQETECQRCVICGPQEEGGSCQPNQVMNVPANITITDRMCTAIESTDYHKDVLCQEYKAPLGYYFECVDRTNSQFSCKSTCGPSIDSIGTGPEFDLLNQNGGLLLGKEANKGSLFDFSNFKNGGALDFGLSGIGKNSFAQNGLNTNGIGRNANNGNSRFQTNNVGSGSSSSSSSSSSSNGEKLSSDIFGKNLFGNQGLNNNVFSSNNGNGGNNLNQFNRQGNNNFNNGNGGNNLNQFNRQGNNNINNGNGGNDLNQFNRQGNNNFNNGNGGNNLNQFNRQGNNNFNNGNRNGANVFQFNNPFADPKASQRNPGFFKSPFGSGSANSFRTPDSFRPPSNGGILNRSPPSKPGPDPFRNIGPADDFDTNEETSGSVHGKRDTDDKYPEVIGAQNDDVDTNGAADPPTNVPRPGSSSGIPIDVSAPSNLEIRPDNSEIIGVRENQEGGYPGPERGIAVGEPYPGSFPEDTQQEGNGRVSEQEKPQGFPAKTGPFAPGKPDLDPFVDSNRDLISPRPVNSPSSDLDSAEDIFINKDPPRLPDPTIPRPTRFNPVNQNPNTDVQPDVNNNDNIKPSANDQYNFDRAGGYPIQPTADVYPPNKDIYARDDVEPNKNGNDYINSYPQDISQSNPQIIQRDNQNDPLVPKSVAQNQYLDDVNAGRGADVPPGGSTEGNPPFTSYPTNQNGAGNDVDSKRGSGTGNSSPRLGGLGEKGVKHPAGLDGSRLQDNYQPEENVNFDGTSLLTDSDYLDRPDKDRSRGKIPKEFEKPFEAEGNIFPGFNDFANGNAASSAFGTGGSVFNLFKDKDSSPPGFQNGDFNFNNKNFLKPDDFRQGKQPAPGSQPQQERPSPADRKQPQNYPTRPNFPPNPNPKPLYPGPSPASPIASKGNPGRFPGSQEFRPAPGQPYTTQERPPYNPPPATAGPQNPLAGPRNPLAGPQNPLAGPRNPLAGTQNPLAGPRNPSAPNGQDYGPNQPRYPANGNGPLYPPDPRYNPLPPRQPINGYRDNGSPDISPQRENYQRLPGDRSSQGFPSPRRPPLGLPVHPGNANQAVVPVYTPAPSGIRGTPNGYPPSGQSYPANAPPYGFRPSPGNPNGPAPQSPTTNVYQFNPGDNQYNPYGKTHPSLPPYYNAHPSSSGPAPAFSSKGYPVNLQNAPFLHPGGRGINGPPPPPPARGLNPPGPGYNVGPSPYPPTPTIERAQGPSPIPRSTGLPNSPSAIPNSGYNPRPYPGPPQPLDSYPSRPFSVPLGGVSSPRGGDVYRYDPAPGPRAPPGNPGPYSPANTYPSRPPSQPLNPVANPRPPPGPFPGSSRAYDAPRPNSPIPGGDYDPYYRPSAYEPPTTDSARGRGFEPQPEVPPRSPDRPPRPSRDDGEDNSRFTPKALLDASPFSFDDPVGSFESPNPTARDSGVEGVAQNYNPNGGSFVPTKPFFAPSSPSANQKAQTTPDDRDTFGRRQPDDFGFDGNFGSFGGGKFDESFASNKFTDPEGYFGDSAFTEDTTMENTEESSSRNETQDLSGGEHEGNEKEKVE